jgi:hypothetical protein
MILDCVLASCNNNELYIDFIPIFIKSWNTLYPNVDVKIILISDIFPIQFEEYKNNIILFKPIPNIETSFISQYIRLLYPCILEYKNGVLITDIDIIPMNSTYYTKNIENIDNNKFIYYRDVLINEYNQIAMCYNVALPETWKQIFNINSIENINQRLIDVYKNIDYVDGHGKSGWYTDQIDLYRYIMEWKTKTNNFIYLNDNNTSYNRLDRDTFTLNSSLINLIKNKTYSDYHMLRPYKDFKDINNTILSLL